MIMQNSINSLLLFDVFCMSLYCVIIIIGIGVVKEVASAVSVVTKVISLYVPYMIIFLYLASHEQSVFNYTLTMLNYFYLLIH